MLRTTAARSALLACLCVVSWAASDLPPCPISPVPLVQTSGGPDSGPDWTHAAFLGPLPLADAAGMPLAATTARLCRTDRALWLLVECTEPRMDRIKADHQGRDADAWKDDCVEVFVQPRGRDDYLHFVTNPAGTAFDERGKDAGWNAQWGLRVTKEPGGWFARFELPWASLGGPPVQGDSWRLNICRSRTPEHEISAWSPTGGGFHNPERFGTVHFADTPCPTHIAWSMVSRRTARFSLAWSTGTRPQGLVTDVNHTPCTGQVNVREEGAVPLVLSGRMHDTPLFRTVFVVGILPLGGSLAGAREEVSRLAQNCPAALREAVEALRLELEALLELAAGASPIVAAEVVTRADEIRAECSRLVVKASLLAAGARADSITYGVETSLSKLLKHQPYRGAHGGNVRLDAARREMDAAQVVLFAFDVPLLMVYAVVSDARGNDERTIPSAAFRLRRVGYVPTIKPVYAVDHVGLWPDPLLPLAPFDVREHSFESLWLDVRVPPNARPGVYKAELTIQALNRRPTVVPVDLRVRAFTIPVKHSLCTAFGVRPHYRVPQDTDAFVRNALEHRISPYSVAPGPSLLRPPALDWASVRRMRLRVNADRPGSLSLIVTPANDSPPESFGPHPVEAGENVVLELDLQNLRGPVRNWRVNVTGPTRATLSAALVTDAGESALVDSVQAGARVAADGWLQAWPSWEGAGWDTPDIPAQWDWTEFDEKHEAYLPLGLSTLRAPLRQPLAGWADQTQQHLREKGWLHMAYTYLYDEPRPEDYPKVNTILGEVKQAAPGLRNMMTARHFPPELTTVDIWCPEAYSFDPEAARDQQAHGKAVWWYVAFSTRHPYPNIWVDYPALDCRVWPWMTWKHDLDGMLYWSVTCWNRNDPWQTTETFPRSNGDGSMLYPGADGQPVDSIRWECLRDGMEDYEVLCLLEAGKAELEATGREPNLAREAAQLCAIDDAVVTSYKEYDPDPQALLDARARMSDALERIVEVLGHEPKIKDRPRYRPTVDEKRSAQPRPQPPVQQPDPAPWHMPEMTPEQGLVLRYAFDTDTPFACDRSGSGMHGMIRGAERCQGITGRALSLGRNGGVTLPSGIELLGPQPPQGTVAVWVKPDVAADSLPSGPWDGYSVIVYLMETDGNGLPDGYDEIGLYVHGPKLYARCAGKAGVFAAIPSPLQRDRWAHLCITWTPQRRCLYVDGKLVHANTAAYPLPKLDGFRGALGVHPPRSRWPWKGALDELRIYRRSLAPDEVSRLAHP